MHRSQSTGYTFSNLFILESQEDAKNKAATKLKRFIMQKKLTSSDTSDQENEEVIDQHVRYVTNLISNIHSFFTTFLQEYRKKLLIIILIDNAYFETKKIIIILFHFQPKVNLCKRVAQHESSQKVMKTFQKQILTKNCNQLNIVRLAAVERSRTRKRKTNSKGKN